MEPYTTVVAKKHRVAGGKSLNIEYTEPAFEGLLFKLPGTRVNYLGNEIGTVLGVERVGDEIFADLAVKNREYLPEGLEGFLHIGEYTAQQYADHELRVYTVEEIKTVNLKVPEELNVYLS